MHAAVRSYGFVKAVPQSQKRLTRLRRGDDCAVMIRDGRTLVQAKMRHDA
jgi:hypothetical protein